MAFKIFKSGDELYETSNELIKRGEYAKARDYLVKSIEKDGGIDDVAEVQVAIIDLSSRQDNPKAYQNLINSIDKLKSQTSFEFGLETINAAELRQEASLQLKKMRLLSEKDGGNRMQTAQELQTVALEFQTTIGERSMILNTLFRKTTVTGNWEFYNLMAVSYEMMSDAVKYSDTQKAAEYQQVAAGYRQQNGQSAEENLKKVREYAKTSTCWVCGRIANGEGINFYSAPAEVPPSLKDNAHAAAESRADTKHIYICRACYTAISNRSDEIALRYHNKAMQEMRSMEARLQAEIAALQAQISFARMGR